ncbi:hypothetical protein [Fibrella aestuarina]|uniref:hypothetical protein n=1 Tax=Fibrella aestuarina TaxID=651143 RepID=UPI000687AB2A|nr:hypothetical protein [Fibrella aestuarina]
MGQTIAHELKVVEGSNILGRWMAHRVAELMDRAEAAASDVEREAAKKECSDLILNLWQKRNCWPNGGPFTTLYPTFKRLFQPPSEYYHFFEEPDAEETGLVSRLIDIHQREMKLFVTLPNVAASPAIVQASRETLTRYNDMLSDKEKELLLFMARQEPDDNGTVVSPVLAEELDSIIPEAYGSLKQIEQERLTLIKEATISSLK